MSILTVEFGGLCMFVRRTRSDKVGLWLLMPSCGTPNTTERCHCPMIEVPPQNHGHANAYKEVHPFRGHIDWSPLDPMKPPPGTEPPELLKIFRYAGNLPVLETMFNNTLHNRLAVRFLMPLGTRLWSDGVHRGNLRVEGNTVAEPFDGVVKARFDLGSTNTLTIKTNPPIDLIADSVGSIAIKVLYIPHAYLDYPEVAHDAGTCADHVQAYYPLVGETSGPALIIDKAQGTAKEPIPQACLTRMAQRHYEPAGIRYIDPLNCTVGLGCPPEQPYC